MGDNLTAIDLGFGRTAKQISSGQSHVCAILDNNQVKCWGDNVYGELGKGNNDDIGRKPLEMGDNLTSIDLGTGRTASQITSGINFNCAILDDEGVKCWGRGTDGQVKWHYRIRSN